MAPIRKVAIFGDLVKALEGHDAVVCVVGPAGIQYQAVMVEAAEAAKVKRFILNDFGWGPDIRSLPEFHDIHAQRRAGWDRAQVLAKANPEFTYTGITTGNPIDWALQKFPLMGFNIAQSSAIIYDSGTERFTGTTLTGIGQAVVGVLQHPKETANRFVKAQSIQTCQNELLEAFEIVTGKKWDVQKSSVKTLLESGRSKAQAGTGGWVLDLVVAQLFEEGEARCMVAPSREESDAELLGMEAESPQQVVSRALSRASNDT
ncbi:predicted protein [Uncinocarpus reesii 1704]|uniref:NmrA-like domain-containing protein n=1 Tax=Uncinocarpus reesii (strain UAMH 1704) TaxID=336963 RepID=C4JLH3_UNCRE|nr:uncharacterized protein UREG_03681 [Uncinocarpus reesii 1704]EEP78835.1 predicted protein [Uncinocarpus reesii 1704]